MAMSGLYRRTLPSPPAVDFASLDGKQIFLEAIHNGTMEGFYRLISYFQTQSEPAYCGLASLSMVLNALSIDPGRKWKGPWRWFDESMLDCCEPLEKVKAQGISFGKLVCLAHCAGAHVEAFRTNHTSLDKFRNYVRRCVTSDNCHIITSYDRVTFKQTGSGHFSPIGGYHAGKDMILILDVARFKYPPHWVPLTLLWEAMDKNDEATGQRRGFMLISRTHIDAGFLFTLSCKDESWVSIAKCLMDDVPLLLNSGDVKDVEKVISIVFTSLPSDFVKFLKWIAEVWRHADGSENLSQEEKTRFTVKAEVLKQVQRTKLFKHVRDFLLASTTLCCENIQDVGATVCCEGGEILGGRSVCSSGYYRCSKTRENCLKSHNDDETPITVVSGMVMCNNNGMQEVDMLVPLCHTHLNSDYCDCVAMYPGSNDVLTMLIFALPRETWSGIKDKMILQEFYDLSTETLPTLLRQEVLHLRKQLLLLKMCHDNKVEDYLGVPFL